MEPEDMIGTPLLQHGHLSVDAVKLVDWSLYPCGELRWDKLEEHVDECMDIRQARVLWARAAWNAFVVSARNGSKRRLSTSPFASVVTASQWRCS